MRLLLLLVFFQLSISLFGQTPPKTPTIDFDSIMKARADQMSGKRVTKPITFDPDSLMKAKRSQIFGRPFPHFVATNEKGKMNNDSLIGKVVLINFWFQGCPPCVAEFDALNELAQKLKENNNFKFISFTWDDIETVKNVKEKYKLQYDVFQASERECIRLNQESAFPTTIILDKHGIIKYWDMGGAVDPAEARKYIMTTLLPKIQQEL